MRKTLNTGRIGSSIFFIGVVAIALSLLGCAPQEKIVIEEVRILIPTEKTLVMIPLTDDIIKEVGGMDKTKDFQYYISKTIILSLVDGGEPDSVIGKEGQVIRTGTNTRDTVTISSYTPGVLQGYAAGTAALLGNRLSIAFEDYPGKPVVAFARQGSSDKYEIVYVDRVKSTINYGSAVYTVSFVSPDDPPYLMVTIQENITERDSSRKASGLKLADVVK